MAPAAKTYFSSRSVDSLILDNETMTLNIPQTVKSVDSQRINYLLQNGLYHMFGLTAASIFVVGICLIYSPEINESNVSWEWYCATNIWAVPSIFRFVSFSPNISDEECLSILEC